LLTLSAVAISSSILKIINPLPGKKLYVHILLRLWDWHEHDIARHGINLVKHLVQFFIKFCPQWRSVALKPLSSSVSFGDLTREVIQSLQPCWFRLQVLQWFLTFLMWVFPLSWRALLTDNSNSSILIRRLVMMSFI
jgi:hypothetical protein